MDSLSQLALGSAVAYVVAGKQAPRLALVAGATLGTLPDLDVMVKYVDPMQDMIRHRTWSHSWLVQTAVSPLLAWGAQRLWPQLSFARWWCLVWLCLITHSMLDAFTVYGTAVWWPLPLLNVMQGSIFIIDPLFTVPLVAAVVLAWRRHKAPPDKLKKARKWVTLGLGLSCVYLLWGLIAQQHMLGRLSQQLAQQGINAEQTLAMPMPFNSLLWRVMAIDGDTYVEGVASVLDENSTIALDAHPRHFAGASSMDDLPSFNDYKRFSHGFYRLDEVDGEAVIRDLRMGYTPYFVFQFVLAQKVADRFIGVPPRTADGPVFTLHHFGQLLSGTIKRIFNQDQPIHITPPPES